MAQWRLATKSISLSDPAYDDRRRWEKKVSVYVNFGWEHRTASTGWCLIWSPFVQRKRTGALHIPLSNESCVNLSVLCRTFIIPSGVPPSIGFFIFRRSSRPPSGSPSSVGRSALRQSLRLLSVIPPSVKFSIRRSVVRWAFRPPLSVPPSVGYLRKTDRKSVVRK